jgi:hypothetical protein
MNIAAKKKILELYMKTVLISFPWENKQQSPVLRQTPETKGAWKGYQFYINEAPFECDYQVVYGGHKGVLRSKIPQSHSLFIGAEPPSIKKYSEAYLAQFGAAICCDPELKHPHLTLYQQGYLWFCGMRFTTQAKEEALKSYDDYKNEERVEKTKLLSVVCSDKQAKSGHRKRFEFVKRLKEEFGDEMDWFGTGQNQVADKADAIRPYKYHIAIENSSYPHYWTEKLSDCYLEQAFPFYAGCPNVDQYFSKKAFQMIDLDDPEASIQIIRRAIDEDRYQQSIAALQEAKRQVLDDYNLFNLIAEHFDGLEGDDSMNGALFKAFPAKWFKKGPLYRFVCSLAEKFRKKAHR